MRELTLRLRDYHKHVVIQPDPIMQNTNLTALDRDHLIHPVVNFRTH